MNIILDSREAYLKKEFDQMGIMYQIQQLDVGDVVINSDSSSFVFERKTYSDLYSSIVSSRFREQRQRLLQAKNDNESIRVFYIIEGLCKLDAKKKNIVQGAIDNLVLIHQIPVLFTNSISDTAARIVKWKDKLQDQESTATTAIALKTVKRKHNITENMFFHQLNLIPGVSAKISEKITELYPTISSLLSKYNDNDNVIQKELLLADIQLGNRKLGKVLSSRIYHVYTCSKEAQLQ